MYGLLLMNMSEFVINKVKLIYFEYNISIYVITTKIFTVWRQYVEESEGTGQHRGRFCGK